MDPKKNYYDILGVSESANADEIKKAFKKLAVQHHPDKKWGNKEKFQEINEAYQTLGDDQKRQQYDMYRKGWFSGDFNGGFGGFGGFGWGGFDVDLWDIVGDIFGGFGGFGGQWNAARKRRGEDIKQTMTIDFDDAYLGVTKRIKYHRRVLMQGVEQKDCSTCRGRWKVAQQAQTPFGVMQIQNTCPSCGGTGVTYTKDGKALDNDGLEKVTEELEVKVPAWIKDWVYMKYTGKGNAGFHGAVDGDLYIKILIKPSSVFERKGDDMYAKVSMSIFDLVLGGTCEINHPEGKLEVKIPKGTQITDLVKVSNKGFGEKGVFSSRGNLYIVPDVKIPKKLSKDEEKLWQELRSKE